LMPGPVSHEAQESNLREWCNAPSAIELRESNLVKLINFFISFNSAAIKGEKRSKEATHTQHLQLLKIKNPREQVRSLFNRLISTSVENSVHTPLLSQL
jgi:hypothetical protein